jgi:hypothetical protein
MQAYVHLWWYCAKYFLEWEMFQLIKTLNFFSWKLWRLWDNMVKYGTAGKATDDNKILRMRFACQITKATAHIVK